MADGEAGATQAIPQLRWIGKVELNAERRVAQVDGVSLGLTGMEYAVLDMLAYRQGQVVTRGALLAHLYGGITEPQSKIIDVFICKLRKKLAQAGIMDLIGNVWGKGYLVR